MLLMLCTNAVSLRTTINVTVTFNDYVQGVAVWRDRGVHALSNRNLK